MRQDKLDLIIEGGWVIDGLGGPRVRADVGVADGRIAALGDLSGYIADRRLDAPDASWRPASSTCTVTTT